MDNAYGMDIDPQAVKLERLRAGMEQILSSGGHVLHSGRIFVPRDAAERLRLLEQNAAVMIVTGDGMMDSPRARWYYQYLLDHPPSAGDGEGSGKSNHNGVLLTGHASSGSFGKHLLDCTNQKTGQKTDRTRKLCKSHSLFGAGCDVKRLDVIHLFHPLFRTLLHQSEGIDFSKFR
ncbi:hypothetical protein [Paenibacillus sp. NPDC055715]